MFLDQLEFSYYSNENDETEIWNCSLKDCRAAIFVDTSSMETNIILEKCTEHLCSLKLTMKV